MPRLPLLLHAIIAAVKEYITPSSSVGISLVGGQGFSLTVLFKVRTFFGIRLGSDVAPPLSSCYKCCLPSIINTILLRSYPHNIFAVHPITYSNGSCVDFFEPRNDRTGIFAACETFMRTIS